MGWPIDKRLVFILLRISYNFLVTLLLKRQALHVWNGIFNSIHAGLFSIQVILSVLSDIKQLSDVLMCNAYVTNTIMMTIHYDLFGIAIEYLTTVNNVDMEQKFSSVATT